MVNAKKAIDKLTIAGQQTIEQFQQAAQNDFKQVMWKKLRGGFLLVIGYLLSPLCWWNDLFFNLPIAYFFGYVCSWLSPDLLLPCSILGYWLSNIAGILLMQVGAVDVVGGQPKERNLKKELMTGLASSTAYTL
ncbi:MAG TPA: hypothetical protein V6D12_20630, partial [Candidatus Obscuribacterales bacterium]